MESLWRLEDKWNLSTHGAVILFVCTASLLMGVCAATFLKRRSVAKRNQLVEQAHFVKPKWSETTGCFCSWGGSVKRALMATVRWSGASKWEEQNAAAWQKGLSPSPLLGRESKGPVTAVGLRSHNSESPVWQRPILMGEKCQMPRFSGLILYDERGQPLHNEATYVAEIKQEKTPAKGRTTLRDLL